jgi:uncharacterized protein (UPF0332 family)
MSVNTKYCKGYQISYNDTEFSVIKNKLVLFKTYEYMKNIDNEKILKYDWEKIEIYESCVYDYYICVFYDVDKWFLAYKYNIVDFSCDDDVMNNFKNLFEETNDLNKNLCYHFLMNHKENKLSLLFTTNKYQSTFGSIKNTVHFNNYEQLLLSLDKLNSYSITNKNIINNGYIIKINDELFVMYTNIYKFILCNLPKNKNQYWNYLELYQCNKLYDILPYVHKYPYDTIHRIHNSIQLLSGEILNIYHLTRNKKNELLYNSLTKSYKSIIYDLHSTYINNKLRNKMMSIRFDNVYYYLKHTKPEILRQIFFDRKILIEKLLKTKFDIKRIISTNDTDNIDLIIQTELMSN